MLRLSRMGVIISPPVPAFYNQPKTVDDIVDHTVTYAGSLRSAYGRHAAMGWSNACPRA
jgi:hypothetical protein